MTDNTLVRFNLDSILFVCRNGHFAKNNRPDIRETFVNAEKYNSVGVINAISDTDAGYPNFQTKILSPEAQNIVSQFNVSVEIWFGAGPLKAASFLEVCNG